MNTIHHSQPLSPEAIATLRAAGCSASDWSRVRLHPDCDLSLFSGVEFEGDVEIGLISHTANPRSCLRNTLIADSTIGDGARIRYVAEGIFNTRVGSDAIIENCGRIEFDRQPPCAMGLRVGVLDESGAREVAIYPGLSAQTAMLMARGRHSVQERLLALVDDMIDSGQMQVKAEIGPGARISGCGRLTNVAIGHDVVIEGARSLRNGMIVNNAPGGQSACYVGSGVDADGFIIEDATVDSGVLLRNCYVGQGVRLEKGFTAHDSLFFANCSMENGEACALFAGPYSVSMHKGTLLIGCQTSFMNAGSSTNQSNHMYKLGPIHWGVLERGVKTSSGSYLMLGANIGAFSLLMGQHKTHPDSREFPFSYLFGDSQGATVVVPGVMLRSCGLLRDEQKWPARDRRAATPGLPLNDRVVCDVLNPVTVDAMIEAIEIIRPMLNRPADDDRFHRYKGMKLSRASLERAIKLYSLGIMKYLSRFIDPDGTPLFPADGVAPDDIDSESEASEWIDLSGQPIPRRRLEEALGAAESIDALERSLSEAYVGYQADQRDWIVRRFPRHLRVDNAEIMRGAGEFDRLVELDRDTYRATLSAEAAMLRL